VTTMTLSSRLDALRPTAVNSILAEVRAVQATGATVVSLMRGEPDFRTPPHIAEAAARALTDGRTSYADNRGELRLREAVVAKLLRDNAVTYDAGSEILVTTGATFGTVRTRARMPSTLSMPRATDCASERTAPVAL